jgi:hypothetical protein
MSNIITLIATLTVDLALVWMVVRAVLTFLVGMSFLAALVGLGGWALTRDPSLWGMFWKSALACLNGAPSADAAEPPSLASAAVASTRRSP